MNDIQIEYQNKLESRKDEVVEFATEVAREKKAKHIKVWETKRHDLAAVILGNK